jgi:GNAT superfamily N-acetyltransferase
MACSMSVSYRPATLDDAPFAASRAALVDPTPQTSEELRRRWDNTNQTADVRRFIVTTGDSDAGWLSLVRPLDEDPEAVYLHLLLPDAPATAVDDAAGFGEEQARDMNARRVLFNAWANRVEVIEALQARGWNVIRRQRYWRLRLQPHAGRLKTERDQERTRQSEGGITLTTAADLGGESAYPGIYAVADATYGDIPSSVAYVSAGLESWLTWMRTPTVHLDRLWVAVDGERMVGLSFLDFEDSLVHTGYTGVLRDYRGRGIARALKLETLVQAAELGVEAVETDNDSENAPILHLNAELGYDEIMGQLQLVKTLD